MKSAILLCLFVAFIQANECPELINFVFNGTLQGSFQQSWKPVADAMWENCANHSDSGAVSVYHRGCVAVYVWCGVKNNTSPWTPDTLTNVFSMTKSVSAMSVMKLVDQGYMDYDDYASEYWPAFASRGKDNITIGMLTSHAAALPTLATPEHPWPSFTSTDISITANQSFIEQLILEQYMAWESAPDNYRCGYHVNDWGWLLNPFVKRADPLGRDISEFMKQEFAVPLNIELYYGILPNESSLHDRVAFMVPGNEIVRNSSAFQRLSATFADASSMQFTGLFTPIEVLNYYYFAFNQPALRNTRHEGGILYSTAHDLAKLFSILSNHGKTKEGRRYLKHGSVSAAAEAVCNGEDLMNYEHTIYTRAGFNRNDGQRYNLYSNTAFAKVGAGGQLAVIEPRKRANFVYVTSVMESDSDESAFKDTANNILIAFSQVTGSLPDEP